MSDPTKPEDPYRYIAITMPPNKQGTVIGAYPTEPAAREGAERHAKENDGVSVGVYQRIGTAELEHKVAWKGVTPR